MEHTRINESDRNSDYQNPSYTGQFAGITAEENRKYKIELKKFGRAVSTLFALASLNGAIIGTSIVEIGSRILDRRESQRLTNLVSVVADENNDGVTSEDEWKKAYRDCGVQYDELHKRELTRKEMQGYLDRHPTT